MKENELVSVRRIFPLRSRLVFAPAVIELVPKAELSDAFARHDTGDWGIVSAEVREINNKNLCKGGSITSVYQSKKGVRFSVTTSADSRLTEFSVAAES